MNVLTRFTAKSAMRLRLTTPLLVALSLLLAAFCTGSPVFLAGAALILLLCLSSVLAVWQVSRTFTVTDSLGSRAIPRGEQVVIEVEMSFHSLLPVAPLMVEVVGPDREPRQLLVDAIPRRRICFPLLFHAAHVGETDSGVEAVTVSDLLGLCTKRIIPHREGERLLVLPRPFDAGPQLFHAGEAGSESMARAAEDISSPADVRLWQSGDPMRKIHWKLSARRQELMVRRYEAPVTPDALVLLDCTAPPRQPGEEALRDMQDALLETAASVMAENLRTGHPARLPLTGRHPIELDRSMGMPAILEALAHVDFSAGEPFERVLLLELRRMRRVGSTVVISARLNSAMVDAMASMRRMGPHVRLYLTTFTPEEPGLLPMISQLQNAGVEVCYVTPLPM